MSRTPKTHFVTLHQSSQSTDEVQSFNVQT